MDPLHCVVLIGLAALVGVSVGYGVARIVDRIRLTGSRASAAVIRAQAQKEAENIRKEAELRVKDDLYQKREEFNREAEKTRAELRDQERRLEKREDGIEQNHQHQVKKERALEHAQRKLHEKREQVEKREQDLERVIQEQNHTLHEICNLSREDAEKLLLQRLQKELSNEVAARIQKHEEQVKSISEEKARQILATAIHRYAAQHTADTTVSTVDIPSDDMKGRIIGREGRNIRTFEKCTGVDVI